MPAMTFDRICTGHKSKTLNSFDRRHVLLQLQAENHKRLESFVFEQIFVQSLQEDLGTSSMAVGWIFLSSREINPPRWFKVMHSGDHWTKCDSEMLEFLRLNGASVTRIIYDDQTAEFNASRWQGTDWGAMQPLVSELTDVPGTPKRRIRNMSGDVNRRKAAIREIDSRFSDDQLCHLSTTRILLNCYLAPWFGTQPMDIDVCCLIDQRIVFLEFKRKYPARSQQFGIDVYPHGTLINWLEKAGNSLVYVVLVDPLWKKDISPLHLVSPQSSTAPFAVWLATQLRPADLTGKELSTSGSDSGMFGGERSQNGLAVEGFREVGRNLQPDNLCQFVRDPDQLRHTNWERLVDLRDQAKHAYRSS